MPIAEMTSVPTTIVAMSYMPRRGNQPPETSDAGSTLNAKVSALPMSERMIAALMKIEATALARKSPAHRTVRGADGARRSGDLGR